MKHEQFVCIAFFVCYMTFVLVWVYIGRFVHAMTQYFLLQNFVVDLIVYPQNVESPFKNLSVKIRT